MTGICFEVDVSRQCSERPLMTLNGRRYFRVRLYGSPACGTSTRAIKIFPFGETLATWAS
jgi:hypothetical protein